MNEHEAIREILMLAAADALEDREQLRVERHLRECESCRRDMEIWRAYSYGLGRLPQPAVPPRLMERTHARILKERAEAAERRWNERVLVFLAVFAWLTGLTVWFLLRMLAGGDLVVIGTNLLGGRPWFVASTALAWSSAAVAALVLSRRREWRNVV